MADRIGDSIAIALEKLRTWGIEPREGRGDDRSLADASIRRDAYEGGRPSEDEACRIGDARFLPAEV